MSIDQSLLVGAYLVGGAAALAEIACLTGSAIVSRGTYRDQKRVYMEAIQQGINPDDLVKPSYLDFFNEEVKDIHAVIFGRKRPSTNYDNSQNI